MPGVALHFLFAELALESWRREGPELPVVADDPATVNAFFHGAVGPDLGYFPGGERLLSDLAHSLHSGALARKLIALARTALERAFAWGWLTHYLADEAIHPIIGRGVGELLKGRRDCFVDGASDLRTHVRVEIGLDAWYAAHAPTVRTRRLQDVFDSDGIRFLAHAYSAVYGVTMDVEPFLRSHRAATRRVGQAMAMLRVLPARPGAARTAGRSSWPWRALRLAYQADPFRSVVLAYLNPAPPPRWLLEEVEGALGVLPDRYLEQVRSQARTLPDVNLDTGRPLAAETHHAGVRRARAGLARLRAGRRPPRALTGTLGLGIPERRLSAAT